MLALTDVIRMCKAYQHMTCATQEQLDALHMGTANLDNTDINAFKHIEQFLTELEGIDDALDRDIFFVRTEMDSLVF